MIITRLFSTTVLSIALATWAGAQNVGPRPSEAQLKWQAMETNAFVHFGPNTFMDKEWGYGDADPQVFYPTRLDADQWMRTFKEAGIKGVILTCKHHDGFCLWPSKWTDYNISRSPWRDGKGDLVREVSDACRRHGLKFGIYLSPWDRHQASYGTPEYVDYYYRQMEELLSNYGDIFEVWLDGANGGDGYYGGACEKRKIDRRTYYHFERIYELIHRLQPEAIIFSDGGPGCRWVGNERGVAATTNWSMLRGREVYPGYDHPEELPEGHEDGDQWTPAECDVSIRPGWFYHESEDSLVKSPRELAEIYYQSVGRNALMLLNFPVNREGRVHSVDSANAVGMRRIIDSEVALCVEHSGPSLHSKGRCVEIKVPRRQRLSCLVLQEDIREGQRIQAFRVEYRDKRKWFPLPIDEETTTIGYKRILRFPEIETDRLRIRITESRGEPSLLNVAF
mgnify:FL=1